MKTQDYCNVIVNTRNRDTDRLYTYKIPQKFINKIDIGSKVIVPFGMGNKLHEGFVFSFLAEPNYKRIKSIVSVLEGDISLSQKQIKFCKWLRERYLCTYYEAISCIIPSGTTLKKRKVYSIDTKIIINKDLVNPNEYKLINLIRNNDKVTNKEVRDNLNFDYKKHLNKLIREKLIIESEEFYSEVNTKYKKVARINFDKDKLESILGSLPKNATKQSLILKYLFDRNVVELSRLKKDTKTSYSTINSLVEKGYILIEDEEDFRNPLAYKEIVQEKKKILNDEQKNVYLQIKNKIYRDKYEAFLLHGVTGSGKTEIYMDLTKDIIDKGKQILILVPEISLTTQIVNKFISRFGKNVAVLHSKLSLGERYDQWKKISDSEISIIIGARSAVFAPCKNLGLVIIDEEHESSYKSEINPKYHTIEVAKYRCKQDEAILLLGSATPSLNSYYKAMNGEYNLLKIKKRFNNNPMPRVEVVDMREELKEGNKSVFSKKLYKSMKSTLENNKQVILFLNRRGYSTFISCRSCGYVLKCDYCDISLTFHQLNDLAKCHYCGFTSKIPKICPDCGSKYIRHFGTGTQKIEEYVNKLFPNHRIKRIDVDTTSRKGELEKIINSFEKREVDILVGTQMVTKGLDFPYVTLVGVLSADITLNFPDFRANERTYQLLTQVAGRAGRHDFKGNVIIQTYNPNNYAILSSKRHDYESFFNTEIAIRKEFDYPPYFNLINIIIYGKVEGDIIKSSNKLINKLKNKIYNKIRKTDISIFGPNPALISKIKESYRWQILIKYKKINYKEVRYIVNDICNLNRKEILENNVKLSLDIDPYNIL